MKEETTVQGSLVSLSSSLESNAEGKYGGILKQSFISKTRVELIRLFSYLSSFSVSLSSIYLIVSVIRILQFFGPSLCIQYPEIWDPNGFDSSSVSILSFSFHLIPINLRDQLSTIFLYLFLAITLTIFFIMLYSNNDFKENSKVIDLLGKILSFYFSSFSEFFHIIALQLSFERLSKYFFITKGLILSFNYILEIFVIITILILMFIVINVTSLNLSFRKSSLLSVSILPHTYMYIITPLLTSLLAFGTYSPKFIKIGLLITSSIIYIYSLKISTISGGFIDSRLRSLLKAISITGFFTSLGTASFLVISFL